MDRKNIDKIAQTDEDKMLLAKVWDKIQAGITRNVIAATGFLSPRELNMTRFLFGDIDGLIFYGGYEDAERKMLLYLPDYLSDTPLQDTAPIVCIRAGWYAGESLTHRDLLGALMGAGIDRQTVGDICISDNSCDFFVTRQIAPFILQNLESAGRTKLQLQTIDLSEANIPQPQTQQIRDTVASVRLDSVIASGFRVGRALACQHITAGRVSIDGLPCEKPDKPLTQGAKISVRGLGKIVLQTVGGQTKKGRISIIIDRYI